MVFVSFTIAPIYHLSLYPTTQIPFGGGFLLKDVPRWLRDESTLQNFSRHDRDQIKFAQHAFVAEYPDDLDDPDKDLKDKKRTVREAKFETLLLAGLALWLVDPSPASFTAVFHTTPWWPSGKERVGEPVQALRYVDSYSAVRVFPPHEGEFTSLTQAIRAGKFHPILLGIGRKGPVWTATRAVWAAITTPAVDLRYLLFWIALEALFGANDTNEIAYKLAQRITFFASDSSKQARADFRVVKQCYGMRSKIVHGKWEGDPKMAEVLKTTEEMTRKIFLYLLCHPDILAVFQSTKRDEFLEDWVFSRSTDIPTLPALGS